MKALLINVVCGIGSTGRICLELAKELESSGYEVKIAFGRTPLPKEAEKYAARIGSDWDVRLHALRTRLFDAHGLASERATNRFLQWAEDYNPDLLWLHNIHGYYINYEALFRWIKSRPSMEVRWTLHDCWAFTGHCAYFTMAQCEQWKEHCSHCVQKKKYPSSVFVDNCFRNFERKQAAFTGVPNLTLITPCQWLANLVKESFLKEYPTEVRYNSINTDVFKPTPSDFRERYGLQDKKIILGVANIWGARKGLDDFIQLADMLDERYAIALVGLSAKRIRRLPKQIIGIRRTNSASELAAIYTAADVFVNPTYEDNYPTVNLEAQACGTPVFTYDTGGCPETIRSPHSRILPRGDRDALKSAIENYCLQAESPSVKAGGFSAR